MTPYADLEYATNYFSERLHTSAWDNSDNNQRQKALKMATRDIDRLDYVSEFTSEDDDVPEDVKIACCEIALARLAGVDPVKELEAVRIEYQRYSNAGVTYSPDLVPEHVVAQIASPVAWQYLKPLLRENWGIKLNRVD
jgi:hypothetical protein